MYEVCLFIHTEEGKHINVLINVNIPLEMFIELVKANIKKTIVCWVAFENKKLVSHGVINNEENKKP
jgi:hypothetical protein